MIVCQTLAWAPGNFGAIIEHRVDEMLF